MQCYAVVFCCVFSTIDCCWTLLRVPVSCTKCNVLVGMILFVTGYLCFELHVYIYKLWFANIYVVRCVCFSCELVSYVFTLYVRHTVYHGNTKLVLQMLFLVEVEVVVYQSLTRH